MRRPRRARPQKGQDKRKRQTTGKRQNEHDVYHEPTNRARARDRDDGEEVEEVEEVEETQGLTRSRKERGRELREIERRKNFLSISGV